MTKRFDIRTQQWIAWGLLVLSIVVYTLEMGHQAILRYDTFKATAFDLGNYDQAIWNTIHGRLFQFTNQAIDWYGPPTRLGVHFEPILLPISLFYAIHADPRTLLMLQTIALALGALPVFLLARKYLPEWPILAALFAVAYLLSPAVLGENIFDFHPVTLATPLLLYAMLALTYKRYVWFLIACVLAASCKEDVPLAIALLGLLLIWRYKHPRLGLALFVGGFAWSALAFGVVIPHFFPGQQANNFWYRYETLGNSPSQAILNLVIHPWLFFSVFVSMERVYYIASLTRNTGFLSFLAPEWLLPTLPSLAVNLLSTSYMLYSGVYHYNATIVPFVTIAAIIGARRLLVRWSAWRGEPMQEVELIPGITDAQPGAGPALTALYKRAMQVSALSAAVAWARRAGTGLWRRVLGWLHPVWWGRQWERFSTRMIPLAKRTSLTRLQWSIILWMMLLIVVNYTAITPTLNSFWADHDPGPREQHIQQLLAMIPPDASVSASENLNPHLSERQRLAVFPSFHGTINGKEYTVDYIIVDLNAVYPEDRARDIAILNQLWSSCQFRVVARAEGVVLLQRNSSDFIQSCRATGSVSSPYDRTLPNRT